MPTAAAIAMQGDPVGRIGPNAVTRVAEALRAVEGAQLVDRVFRAADLAPYLNNSPSQMIDEGEVARLGSAGDVALPRPVRLRPAIGRTAIFLRDAVRSPR